MKQKTIYKIIRRIVGSLFIGVSSVYLATGLISVLIFSTFTSVGLYFIAKRGEPNA